MPFRHVLARSLLAGVMRHAHAGRDPKAFPPPMKICREMVDAMGGPDSEMYRNFRTLACEAYNLLRKHSKLLLSLCHLMAGAAIPDMRADPEKALLKVQVGAWVALALWGTMLGLS